MLNDKVASLFNQIQPLNGMSLTDENLSIHNGDGAVERFIKSIDLYLFIGFLGADKSGESGVPVNKRFPVKGSEVYPIRMNCIRFLLTLQY